MEIEPRYWTPSEKELIKAVFVNDVARVKVMIDALQDRRILDDVGWVHIPFPLHYITLCLDTIWCKSDEWEDREYAMSKKEQIDAMIEFWREYYDVETFPQVDCCIHEDYYYDRSWETDADLLWSEPSEYVAAGNLAKDVDLYCAVCRFDFERTKQLLEDGANPDANLKLSADDDEPHNALHRIFIEMLHLQTEIDVCDEFNWEELDVRLFVALTAHCEMYRLLNQYKVE